MDTIVIKGAKLIDGTERSPLENSVVLVRDSRIDSVGKMGDSDIPQQKDTKVIDGSGKTVMPGLIDTHIHTCMDGEAAGFAIKVLKWNCLQMEMLAVGRLRRTLEMGITTARDGGSGYGWMEVALRDGIERGDIAGPRYIATGYHITVTGGHGYFLRPEFGKFAPLEEVGMHADGADEWRKAARLNIYNGTDNVKVVCSRDIISPGVQIHSQPTFEEIKAAFDEAHSREKKAIAHAQGHKAIMNAVKAGADAIVHGFWMDDECAEEMIKRSVYWEATNAYAALIKDYAMGKLPKYMDEENPGGVDPEWCRKATEVWEDKVKNFKRLVRMGVKVSLGSDAGVPWLRHGYNAMELSTFVELGLTPMEAIIAGTRAAAENLGLSDQIGTIEKGKVADIILVNGDPLKNINVLHAKEKIEMVMKSGKIVRNSLPSPESRP